MAFFILQIPKLRIYHLAKCDLKDSIVVTNNILIADFYTAYTFIIDPSNTKISNAIFFKRQLFQFSIYI